MLNVFAWLGSLGEYILELDLIGLNMEVLFLWKRNYCVSLQCHLPQDAFLSLEQLPYLIYYALSRKKLAYCILLSYALPAHPMKRNPQIGLVSLVGLVLYYPTYPTSFHIELLRGPIELLKYKSKSLYSQ